MDNLNNMTSVITFLKCYEMLLIYEEKKTAHNFLE